MSRRASILVVPEEQVQDEKQKDKLHHDPLADLDLRDHLRTRARFAMRDRTEPATMTETPMRASIITIVGTLT